MNRFALVLLTVFSFLLAGCAHTSSESTVNADGSWSRMLKLSVGKGMTEDEKWVDVFANPGVEWNKSEEIKESEKITTLKRSFKVNEGPFTDIIMRDKDVTKLKNYVIVRSLPGNKLEYYEKIVFLVPNKEKIEKDMETFVRDIKAAMPAGKGTDEDFKVMSRKIGSMLMRILMGPDDHLIGTLMLNPDGAVRRLRAKIGVFVSKLLVEQFGEKLTAEERETTVKKLLSNFDNKILENSKPNPNTEPSSQSKADFVGMSVSVKLPGKVVETNGEIDSFTGEVFWDFASNSAEGEALELRAICQL